MARHHQSKKARHHEHMGMEHYERGPVRHHSGFVSDGEYAGHAARRHQEMQDAGMIHEDHSAIANLPQGVMMKPYPKERDYLPEVLNDDIRSVDEQMGADNNQRRKHFSPHKY